MTRLKRRSLSPELTFVALVALSGLTLGAALLPLGAANTAIAIAIAASKAAIIAATFMHITRHRNTAWLPVVVTLLLLALLLSLVASDVLERA